MRILCKIKDYYDPLVDVYGIDNDIVYDRRDCVLINKIPNNTFFSKERLKDDSKKKMQNIWELNDENKYRYIKKECGKFYYFILEIGYSHYVFEIERYLDDEDNVVIEPNLIEIKNNCVKKSEYPIAILPLRSFGTFRHRSYMNLGIDKDSLNLINNPILSSSYLSRFIDADVVYNELYNYFISVREKEIKDNRNDVQKLESHGFDKKTSFRGKNK
ncbi:MAG: hypothetical protein IKT40_12030 [Bacilli bacterium]|nr:hypothetical protein [Bacilli bacterium]